MAWPPNLHCGLGEPKPPQDVGQDGALLNPTLSLLNVLVGLHFHRDKSNQQATALATNSLLQWLVYQSS